MLDNAVILDITIVSILLYAFLFVLRRFKLTPLIFGFITLIILYLIAYILHLPLTKLIFQEFIKVIVIIFAVIFQREIRKYLEVISFYGFTSYTRHTDPEVLHIIEESVKQMSEHKIGALIIFPGHEPIDRFILNRYNLDGFISPPLLLSIFDHSSPGHDGAVIIEGNKIKSYGVYLTLSRSYKGSVKYGTRHLAALNLARNSDSFIIAVSEERGDISIAYNGDLTRVDFPTFKSMLRERVIYNAKKKDIIKKFIIREYLFILASIAITVFLWWELIVRS
jgi:uncharacterized protein (TIGR00159 family)